MAITVGTILTKAGLDIDTSSFSQYMTLINKAGSISEILTEAGIEIDKNSFTEYTNKLDNIDSIDEVLTDAGLEIDQRSFNEYTSDLDRIDASEDVTTLAGLEIDQASFSEYSSDIERIDASEDVLTNAGLEIDQASFTEYTSDLDRIDSSSDVNTLAGLEIDQSSFSEYTSYIDNIDSTDEVLTKAGLDIDQSSISEYKTELNDLDNRVPIETDARIIFDRVSVRNFTSDIETAKETLENFSTVTKAITGGIFAEVPLFMGEIAASGLEIGTNFEDASSVLVTLYGNLDTAKEKFQWLADFAASTPFEFPELLEATVRLKAYGIEAQDELKTLGDTSSAMGKTLGESVEALSDAMTGEFERLKEFGIKAVVVQKSNLSQFAQYGASVGDTMLTYVNRAGEQTAAAVDRNNREMITSTLNMIWNEKYAGAMETRSKTLTGLASTLKDNLSMALGDFLGYDIQTMEVQTWSLMGVLKELISVSISATNYLSDIPETVQTFIEVSALGVAAASALAGGYLLMSAAADVAALSITLMGTELTVAAWATGIGEFIAVVAALSAGLVYLDEKTGIVSGTLSTLGSILSDIITIDIGFFGDLAEDIGTYLGEAKEDISEFLTWVKDEFGFEIPNPFADFADMIHTKAEVYRSESTADEIASSGTSTDNNPTSEAAANITTSAETTATSVDNTSKGLANSVKGYADDVATYVTGKNEEMEESAIKSADGEKTAWQKAVEDMYANNKLIENAQLAGMSGVSESLAEQLPKGIQGTGEVLGLNDNNDLVIEKADGTIVKLNQLDATQDQVFKGLHKNYAIIIDDGTRSQETIQNLQASYKSMGEESIVVQKQWGSLAYTDFSQQVSDFQLLDTNVGDLSHSTAFLNQNLKLTNSGKFTDVNGQALDLNNILGGSALTADDLNKRLTATDNTSLSNVQGNVSATGEDIDSTAEKTSFWSWGLNTVDGTPFGNINNNVSTAGMMIDTSSVKTSGWYTWLSTLIASPFAPLIGNLGLSEGGVDTNTNKTEGWKTLLGVLIESPFTTLTGNLGITGTDTDINTGKTDDWYNSLTTLIVSPFDTLFGNLTNSDTLVGNVKSSVDDAIGSLTTFGSFTFDTLTTSLGTVYDTLGDILERAKDTVSSLLKVGTSSSSNKSASNSTTNNTTNNNNFTFKTYASESNVTQWVKRAVGK